MMSADKSVLSRMRTQMKSMGHSEQAAAQDHEGMKALFGELQELRKEMNVAKKAASDAAALPYLEMIEAVERRYALLAKLSASSDGSTKG